MTRCTDCGASRGGREHYVAHTIYLVGILSPRGRESALNAVESKVPNVPLLRITRVGYLGYTFVRFSIVSIRENIKLSTQAGARGAAPFSDLYISVIGDDVGIYRSCLRVLCNTFSLSSFERDSLEK